MKVKDFMKKDVITVRPEDRIHKVLEKMKNNSVKQVVIEEDEEFLGFISLSALIRHGFGIGNGKAKNFNMKNISVLNGNEDEHEAARKLINTGVKALPVIQKGKVQGIVGENELIDFVEYAQTEKLANKCICAKKDDTVSTVENKMIDNNISRIPIKSEGKIVGMIKDIDLVTVMGGDKEMEGSPQKSVAGQGQESYKEKERRGKTKAEGIMRSAQIFTEDVGFEGIKKEIKNRGYIILSNSENKIITERDFIELLSTKIQEGVYVQITNLQEEDAFIKRKVDDAIRTFLQKIGKRLDNLESFFLHVKRHETSGKKVKYSIRTKFQTPIGLFVSNAWDWSLVTANQKALDKLEKEIEKKIEKRRKQQRRKKK